MTTSGYDTTTRMKRRKPGIVNGSQHAVSPGALAEKAQPHVKFTFEVLVPSQLRATAHLVP